MASPVPIAKQTPVPGTETYREKATRKFNENPWVPLGCAATVGALTVAMFKLRRGHSQSFNYWLRARVAAQGLTIVALVAGTYSLNQRAQAEARRVGEAEEEERRRKEKVEREREEFKERLRDAEEAYEREREAIAASRAEKEKVNGKVKGKTWAQWVGWSKSS